MRPSTCHKHSRRTPTPVAYYSSDRLLVASHSGWLAYVKASANHQRYSAGSPGAWAVVSWISL